MIVQSCLLDLAAAAGDYSYINTGHSLTDIPADIPNNTTLLQLRNNHLFVIRPGELSHLTELNRIDLSQNNFHEFPYLCDVNETIKQVVLNGNVQLVNVSNHTHLVCLGKLNYLDISWTGVSSIPDLSAIGSTLTRLDIRSVGLSTIEAGDFSGLEVINTLQLQGNTFTSMPDFSEIGSTLKYVNLQSNEISAVNPDVFYAMERLEYLVLANNQLQEFPDFGEAAQTLKQVFVKNNPLTTIQTSALTSIVNLKTIGFGGTALTEIPDITPLGGSLETLSIQHTTLASLPLFANMTALRSLTISDNLNLSDIEADFFHGMNSLRYLDLSNTAITLLPDLTQIADTLEELHLQQLPLTSLPYHQMAHLPALKVWKMSLFSEIYAAISFVHKAWDIYSNYLLSTIVIDQLVQELCDAVC